MIAARLYSIECFVEDRLKNRHPKALKILLSRAQFCYSDKMNTRAKIETRLSSYWKMEIGNVILVPIAMIFFAQIAGSPVGWVSLFTMIPMCGLLVVGGLYWRGKHQQLTKDRTLLDSTLKLAHQTQVPLLILTILASLIAALAWGPFPFTKGTGDRIVATIAAVLAALEYINYYHRQVQHFDHMTDFKRLITGRGFRPSQMSQDLRQWRAKASRT